MKRFLLLLPLLLTAYVCAAVITTEDPFQITCTWTLGEDSGDETWFIDPKLDVATHQQPGFDGTFMDSEYAVLKVTPRKIVLGKQWEPLLREEISVDRSTGEVTRKIFEQEKSAPGYPTAEWEEQEFSYGYDCQKPTRG